MGFLMASNSKATSGLKSQANELLKQHIIYDSNQRAVLIFTSYYGAGEGTPCTGVAYEYVSPTSSQVARMAEFTYSWKAAWDVDIATILGTYNP